MLRLHSSCDGAGANSSFEGCFTYRPMPICLDDRQRRRRGTAEPASKGWLFLTPEARATFPDLFHGATGSGTDTGLDISVVVEGKRVSRRDPRSGHAAPLTLDGAKKSVTLLLGISTSCSWETFAPRLRFDQEGRNPGTLICRDVVCVRSIADTRTAIESKPRCGSARMYRPPFQNPRTKDSCLHSFAASPSIPCRGLQ